MMIKKLFFLIVLFHRGFASGQLTDDTLKKICIIKADKQFVHKDNFLLTGKVHLVKTVQELFTNYFNNIKVFSVHYELNNVDDVAPMATIYALDINTGASVSFDNAAAFFNAVNTTNIPIAPLDKCYLYLFLNQSARGTTVTNPVRYRQKLADKSIFFKDASVLFTNNCGTCASIWPGINRLQASSADITLSTKRNIKMDAVEQVQSKKNLCRYHFVFDGHNNLTSATKDCFE